MKFRFAMGLALALAVPGSGLAAGPCGSARAHRCAALQGNVDFLAVPDITKEIVLAEPVAPIARKTAPEDPSQTFYTGPYIGANKNEHAPTVGYHWSLN
jgi:hypothetical protein